MSETTCEMCRGTGYVDDTSVPCEGCDGTGDTPALPSLGGSAPTDEPWVVWSNYHHSWWGPNQCGYTTSLLRAGLYTDAEAKAIERKRCVPMSERAMSLTDALDEEANYTTSSGVRVVDLVTRLRATLPSEGARP